jgi:hypothetical protein
MAPPRIGGAFPAQPVDPATGLPQDTPAGRHRSPAGVASALATGPAGDTVAADLQEAQDKLQLLLQGVPGGPTVQSLLGMQGQLAECSVLAGSQATLAKSVADVMKDTVYKV